MVLLHLHHLECQERQCVWQICRRFSIPGVSKTEKAQGKGLWQSKICCFWLGQLLDFFWTPLHKCLRFVKPNIQKFCQKKTRQMPGSYYCKRNVIGILNGTRTGRPRCFPGVILGSFAMIRFASFSKFLSGPRVRIPVMEPSLAMINCTYTLP